MIELMVNWLSHVDKIAKDDAELFFPRLVKVYLQWIIHYSFEYFFWMQELIFFCMQELITKILADVFLKIIRSTPVATTLNPPYFISYWP